MITVLISIISVSIKCKRYPSLPQNRLQNPPRGAPPGTLAEGPQNTKHAPAYMPVLNTTTNPKRHHNRCTVLHFSNFKQTLCMYNLFPTVRVRKGGFVRFDSLLSTNLSPKYDYVHTFFHPLVLYIQTTMPKH